MIGDSGYDDHKLYDLSTKRGFELVCPVQRYKNTPNNRLELIEFYESELGQIIYSWRSKSIEPLIEHIKYVFKIDPLPVRGCQKASGITLLSVLIYQIIVYYNCKTRKQHPKAIKHMLGSYFQNNMKRIGKTNLCPSLRYLVVGNIECYRAITCIERPMILWIGR